MSPFGAKDENLVRRNLKARFNVELFGLVVCIALYLIALFGPVPLFFQEPARNISLTAAAVFVCNVVGSAVNIRTDTTGNGHYDNIVKEFLGKDCVFCKSALLGAFPNREACNFREVFSESRNGVHILVTNLDSLIDYIDILRQKAADGVDVRICTIDPESAGRFNVSRAIGMEDTLETRFGSMKSSLMQFLRRNQEGMEVPPGGCADDLIHDKGGFIKIKVYTLIPTQLLFIVDDECFVGFMLSRKRSREIMHLHFSLDREQTVNLSGGAISVSDLNEHFEAVYDDEEYCRFVSLSEVNRMVCKKDA